ncbi:MAG: hypothetical protein KAI02_02465 [Gammaproteobacteria bacterium]|nr:hypothetical protein [Gammaproteobacteria bacterium]
MSNKEKTVADKVAFLLDDQEMLTYDRSQMLPEQQSEHLKRLDNQLNEGFILIDKKITQPDLQQKTQFLALNLVHALSKNDDNSAIMMFSYLVTRLPDLKQVKAKTKQQESGGQQIGIEFVFDEIKSVGQKIDFHPNTSIH